MQYTLHESVLHLKFVEDNRPFFCTDPEILPSFSLPDNSLLVISMFIFSGPKTENMELNANLNFEMERNRIFFLKVGDWGGSAGSLPPRRGGGFGRVTRFTVTLTLTPPVPFGFKRRKYPFGNQKSPQQWFPAKPPPPGCQPSPPDPQITSASSLHCW